MGYFVEDKDIYSALLSWLFNHMFMEISSIVDDCIGQNSQQGFLWKTNLVILVESTETIVDLLSSAGT